MPAFRQNKRLFFLVGIVTVLSLALLSLPKLGRHLSTEILYDLVRSETNGYYQLDFDRLDIDLWRGDIRVAGVRLHPDSTKDFASRGLRNLYSLELEELVFNVKSSARILLKRELLIERVRAVNPSIFVFHNKEAGPESFSLQTGNLYREISDYLNVFRVDDLNLENAHFQHSPSNFKLSNIDFYLENLLMDSTSRPDRRFFTENLELEVRDQTFALRDSIHHISFNRLLLSTADSVLTFDSLRIQPLTLPDKRFNADSNYVIYDVTIPQLVLRGVDYFSAYRKDYLNIKELAFNDSQIQVDAETYSDPRGITKKSNSLQSQLIEVFEQIQVGKLRLINTRLDIKTNQDHDFNIQDLETERADIVLYNILLDSTNYRLAKDKRYFEDIDIILKDYSAYLPDSIHQMKFDLLTMSSFDSTFIFEGFQIDHIPDYAGSADLYSVKLPLFSLHGVDYKALSRKEIRIERAELRQPSVSLERDIVQKTIATTSMKELYDLFKGDYHTIRVKDIYVNDGQLSWAPALSVSEFGGYISDFRIDEETQSWHGLYDHVDLDIKDFSYENSPNYIKVQRVATNGSLDRFLLSDIDLNYIDDATIITGTTNSLELAGIQLDSMLSGDLNFDSLSLTGPKINIQLRRSSAKGNLKTVHDKYVSIEDGQLQVVMEDSSIYRADNIKTKFKIGQDNHLYTSWLSGIRIVSNGLEHEINIDRLATDQAGNLMVTEVKIDPMDIGTNRPLRLSANIPYLNLHGLDQTAIWKESKLKADSVLIKMSNTHAELNGTKHDQQPELELGVELEVGKIELQSQSFNYSSDPQNAFQSLLLPSAEIILEDFHYPHHELAQENMLLYASDVQVAIDSLMPVMKGVDSVFAKKIQYSSQDHQLTASDIHYQNENITVSSLRTFVVNPDLRALLNQQSISGDTLVVDQPHILISTPFHQTESSVQSDSQPLKFGFIKANNYDFKIRDIAKQITYSFGTGDFTLNNASSSGTFSIESILSDEKPLAIQGNGISFPLDDGYALSAEKYNLKLPKNRLELSNVRFISDKSPEAYSSALSEQSNWYNINAQQISFSGMDLKGWYVEGQYRMNNIEMDGVEMLVYLDKSVPRPQSQQKSLPQTLLRDLDHQIRLDTLTFSGDITYREKPELNEEIGEISFNSLNAELTHVTNTNVRNSMRLEADGHLNSGPFEVLAIFDHSGPKDRFSLVGEIKDLPLDSLNKILRPLANVNIRSGYSKQIWFAIKADNELAEGTMKMNYSDLKVQILNPETHDTHGLGQGLKTFFANTFVVKKRNPTFLFLRDGTIFHERDPSRSIFNYWGKSLLSGAVSSVGIHKSDKAQKKYNKEHTITDPGG